jgi:hypothetical protein
MQDLKELIAGSWKKKNFTQTNSSCTLHRDAVSWRESRVLQLNVTYHHKLRNYRAFNKTMRSSNKVVINVAGEHAKKPNDL